MYESVSQKLLDADAFLQSNADLKIKIGLCRYLFSWDYREKIKKNRKKLS